MPTLVVHGAQLTCSFGAAPCSLIVLPTNSTTAADQNEATVNDFVPMQNITGFKMCTAPSNPQVAAAMGAPVPCVPVIPSPWAPGSAGVTIEGQAALMDSDTCQCTWAGVITVSSAGQTSCTTQS